MTLFKHPSIEKIKFAKGLVPVILQNFYTKKVLMLGYMNLNAYQESIIKGYVTFFSRSKKILWPKGESSGNHLFIKNIFLDCDGDTLLIKSVPSGPICHTGNETCWNEVHKNDLNDKKNLLLKLENIIWDRKKKVIDKSYISILFKKGINRIAQKFGEESVELIIESKDNKSESFLNEAADLFFHYIIFLQEKNHSFNEVLKSLTNRNKKNTKSIY